MFWKLASWPFASSSALSAMTSHSASTHGRSALGEVVEHVGMHEFLDAGMTDADAHAAIVVADMLRDRAQPVMPGNAAADFHSDLPGRELDLVMEHGDLVDAELVEMRGLGDRASGLVHERSRQQQQRARGADRAFRRHALKAPPERTDVVALGDRLDRHEADVVAVVGIARARISEADKELHGMASLLSCPAKGRGMQQTPATVGTSSPVLNWR